MKVAVILILVIFIIMVMMKRRAPAGNAARPSGRKVAKRAAVGTAGRVGGTGPYRAVSIKCGPDACEAARAFATTRVLVGQIDKLPLEGCTSAHCNCKFVHSDDRRAEGSDKRAWSGLSTQLYSSSGKPERRIRRGRRKDDF